MGFLSLFRVAAMPIVEVLLVSTLGAFMATDYFNLLHNDARKSLNKIVYALFTPALVFASLTKTVTLEEIISWWFMPVNIGLTFLVGGILGWVLVKLLKPEPYLEGLVISVTSAGNLGNLMLIMVHAICQEAGSPFGEHSVCDSVGLSYAAFSMAAGGFYIWTFAFAQIRSSGVKYEAYLKSAEAQRLANKDFDGDEEASLLKGDDHHTDSSIVFATSRSFREEYDKDAILASFKDMAVTTEKVSFWGKVKLTLLQMAEELLAPPTLAAIAGLFFGAITWLKNLIVGDTAPLHVIQDSIQLLGDGTLPCITLILGGNLIQGLRSSKLKVPVIVGIILIKYLILPIIGIGVVRLASSFGFLPADPLFSYVLMVQFTLPPAMNIGTMTQLVDVGQAECSVLFLWTYIAAAFALTIWSTVFMWILG
uniref:Uncharacterized protein n=1 Tax=Kalanchoe fedtschenkoi TaxID=63787 RepID=A0A7N0UIL1_KALFE